MQQPTRLISTPFAQEGEKTEIQNVTGEFDNSATYRLGFPPLTMQSIRSGGKPPKGTDFNGVLFDITENISFLCKGGRYQYNAGLSTLIGGYPEGSNLLLDDNVTEVVSTVAGNQNNPNINMTGWILKPNKTTAANVADASGETQQQVNYNGGSKWHSRVNGYQENERVVLTNGDIVKSTIDGNTNDPNVNMSGWRKNNVDSLSVEKLSDLTNIKNPLSNQVVFVEETKAFFSYDTVFANANDGYSKIWGWVLQNTKEVNLKDFPRIAGETDDTGRFQRASAKMQRTYATTTIGIEAQAATLLTIPYGNYVISDEVSFVRNTYIVGEGKVNITQTNSTKSTFIIDNFIHCVIKNIRIIGGFYALKLTNVNIGGTSYTIQDCEFYSTASYAIYTLGLTASRHMSCLARIVDCKFVVVNKILYNVSDWCVLQSCWLIIDKSNFEADTAAIYNFSGRLIVKDCLGNPTMGIGSARLNNVRWIDQHSEFGGVVCADTRFGGEQNGIPVVYSFTPLQYNSQQGPSVIVERCQTSTGSDVTEGVDQVGIVKICSGFPRQIIIRDNFYHGNSCALFVEDTYDLPAYLEALTISVLDKKLDIVIKNNARWRTDSRSIIEGLRPEYPEYLSSWVNKGDISEFISVPKPTLQAYLAPSGIDHYLIKYPLKFGTYATSHLVTVSYTIGNPATSKVVRVRNFILNVGTTNRTSDSVLVNYITFSEIGTHTIPDGLDIDSVEIVAGFEGGVLNLPKVRTQKSSMLANEILIAVKGVKYASVTITPLGVF